MNNISGRLDDIFLRTAQQAELSAELAICHPERGEEPWSDLVDQRSKSKKSCFAPLNRTRVNKINTRQSPARYRSGDGTPLDISRMFSRSHPSAKPALAESCPSRASPDNRVRIVCRNWVGFGQP